MSSAEQESLRIDKWLWAARFFKTRKLAADAVAGGKVHLNGQRCKPSKEVKPGTHLHISKDHYSWDITVTGINRQRRPANEATLLYQEDEQSLARRREQIAVQKQQRALMDHSERERRPNKKQRRQIHRFKQG
ncbi:S4 domain-containing protein [Methylomarinum sp. Ch1-1]|uniref:Heat shock protein 15 n=1 Tax=Methylomarinum roseum TaxID=3067653 RepID=A0AAU7NVB2_9GAMM